MFADGQPVKIPKLALDESLEPEELEISSDILWSWTDSSGVVIGAAGRRGRLCWLRLDDLGTFVFEPGSSSVGVFSHGGASTEQLQDVFERSVLPYVLQMSGLELLHASAVELPSGVLAVCGDSGAGKSTLAASLHREGLQLIADDALVLSREAERVMAHSVPFRLRLSEEATAYLGDPGVEVHGDELGPPRALLGIVVLEPAESGDRSKRLLRLSPAHAYSLILGQAYCFDPNDKRVRRRIAESFLDVVARVPVVRGRRSDRFESLATFAREVAKWGLELGSVC